MAMEDPLEKAPIFDAYNEVAKIADPDSLSYFSKWLEMINLEQSTYSPNNTMSALDAKKQVKEDGLKIT